MELMDATWRPLFLLYNNGSCFLSLSADEDKTVSTQFRAYPCFRALCQCPTVYTLNIQ